MINKEMITADKPVNSLTKIFTIEEEFKAVEERIKNILGIGWLSII